MERKIIAIGGGGVRSFRGWDPKEGWDWEPKISVIDEEALRLAQLGLPIGREKINFLFIPTASKDERGYRSEIRFHYGRDLGCEYDELLLVGKKETSDTIAQKIAWADIIYVGGGNTRDMMKIWDKKGVSPLLREAHEQGKVMMGLSAGSICWFEGGLSDSNKFDGDPDWKPMWVKGLGLLPILNSPHLDSEVWRKEELDRYLETGEIEKPILGVEDSCALVVVGDNFRIVNSRPGQAAYLYRGKVCTRVPPSKEFQPLQLLA